MWRCERCCDVGWVLETIDGRDWARPCRCRRSAGGADSKDPLAAARIPPAYEACTLGNFVARTPALRDAYEQVLAYCREFPHQHVGRGVGLLLWGPKGGGKTHLAAAALAELVANKGVSGRFWDFTALLHEIGRWYDKSTLTTELAGSPLQSALEVELLLLDDLASRRMPDWAHNTLFEIIDWRYRHRRPTLITTSLEDVDRETALNAPVLRRDQYLIERVTGRIRSRLLEMCAFIPMQSSSERDARREPPRPSTLRALRGRRRAGTPGEG